MLSLRVRPWLVAGLAAGALGSLTLLRARGTEDVETWRLWMRLLGDLGLRQGFAASGGIYPPGTFIWLYAVIRIAALLGLQRFVALKLSLAFALGLTSLLLWAWTRNLVLALASFLSLALNGVALGYTDAYFAPLLVLSLWAMARGHPATSGALLAASFLVKWQPLILAPFFVVWLAAEGDRSLAPALRRVVSFLAGSVGVVGLSYVVFGPTLFASLRDALNHVHLSGNALNLNWILGHLLHALRPDVFGPLSSGPAALKSEALLIATAHPLLILPQRVLFAGCYILALIQAARLDAHFRDFVRYALLGFLAYCILSTGVHENHFFAALLLAAVLVGLDETSWPIFLAWAVAANLNLWTFYGLHGRPPHIGSIVELSLVLAVSNVVLFAMCYVSAIRSSRFGGTPSSRA